MAVRIESQSEPIAGYRLLDRLGSGGFGEVWRAEAPGGIFKAIKVIHGDLRNRENDGYRFAEQELKSLKRVKQVRHPYLLALDRFDIVDGRLLIVMELADCNLWDRFRVCRRNGLPGIPREELLRYMAEAGEVLDLMNDQFQLQHLDIKPQNLFLLYNHVKVADFGQVKDLEGMVASVTGGITPVYAAPETFDGFVSRYCDQYSLACVYQELLTGERPFDGNSMQQLLMQHLQLLPNLEPSPPCDRPALAKALAKKAEDRFPTVTAMVTALRGGIDPGSRAVLPALPFETATASQENNDSSSIPAPAPDSTPGPRAIIDTPRPERPAPPEETGPGSLRPTLIIGIGYTGLRVLQRLRKQAADRFGPPERTPLVRCLYLDTDPDAELAAESDQVANGLAALTPEQVFIARLNRAGHYLKPRLNGRTLLEGWFDPQLLYRLPRTPSTMGLRSLGRLAFCDHYRLLSQKLDAELETCLGPEARDVTRSATNLNLRTNRPRVYVVAGLGGGTGAGMFLDVAYAARARLKRIGYTDPDVVGVLLLPPDQPGSEVSAQAQANVYAALTELHHYCRPETTFAANYDDRAGLVRDNGPPFTSVVAFHGLPYPTPPPSSAAGSSGGIRSSGTVPAPTARTSGIVPAASPRASASIPQPSSRVSGSIRQTPTRRASAVWTSDVIRRPLELDGPGQDPTAAVAEYLRLDLFTGIGRASDSARPAPLASGSPLSVRAVGFVKFAWPRAEVVSRTARVIAPVLLGHWVSPDPTQVREVIPGWALDQWSRLGLNPENLTTRLTAAADRAAGRRVADAIAASIEPLVPKGWLPRLPDAAKVSQALDQWRKLIGRSAAVPGTAPTPIEEALASAADAIAEEARRELGQLFPGLIETPLFRLAGTEEAIRQTVNLLDKTRTRFEQQAAEHDARASAAHEHLVAVANFQKGMRKVTAAEFAEAVRTFPTAKFENVLARSAIRVYRGIRDTLTDLLNGVANCRQRVERCRPRLKAEADVPHGPAHPGDLLPPGCASVEDAAQMFIRSLTDDDLHELDTRIQEALERTFGGLYEACLNSADGTDGLMRVFREETRSYLDARLGEVDFAAMIARHFGSKAFTAQGLVQAFESAAPKLAGEGPWAKGGLSVFAGPAGTGGNAVRELVDRVLPMTITTAEARDEIVIYREFPSIPLSALPQLGPAWTAAYRSAPEVQQTTAHARLDVTKWIDVDGD